MKKDIISRKNKWAMFLDFDGTLVDIATHPESIKVPSDLGNLLCRLNNTLNGSLAILTGRSIDNLLEHLHVENICIAGGHGSEFLIDNISSQLLSESLPRDLVSASKKLCLNYNNIELEIKKTSIAFHYRSNPEIKDFLAKGIGEIIREYPINLYKVIAGRRVFEIAPLIASKGMAVGKFMSFEPFNKCRPVIIGDDITDETAFEAIREYNGIALKVAGEHFSRESADFSGPSEVINWLKKFIDDREIVEYTKLRRIY